MIRVGLLDDHKLFAQGLKSLFNEIPNYQLDYYWQEVGAFFREFRNNLPEILLIDINLGDASGIEVCRRIRESNVDVKIIALTMVNERSMIRAMINAGANGYLLKNTSKVELIETLDQIIQGRIVLGKETQKIIDNNSVEANPTKPKRYTITRREKEVLHLIIAEKTTQEIADILGIAFSTVETHRKNLGIKLGARNTAGLVRIAIEEKIV